MSTKLTPKNILDLYVSQLLNTAYNESCNPNEDGFMFIKNVFDKSEIKTSLENIFKDDDIDINTSIIIYGDLVDGKWDSSVGLVNDSKKIIGKYKISEEEFLYDLIGMCVEYNAYITFRDGEAKLNVIQ